MKRRVIKGLGAILLLMLAASMMTGCAQTMRAIENRSLSTNVRMSDTIFLDPEALADNNKVYVRVTNTSQMQNIAFRNDLLNKLRAKGYAITGDPHKAGIILQANVLYMDLQKEHMTADSMLAGGFGGALAGNAIGGGSSWEGATVGAAVGSLAGAAVGAMVHVDTFVGTVDIQIEQRIRGGVTGTMTTNASQGTSTTLKTTRKIRSDFQTYRTRIVATATQTNINKDKAAQVLSEKLAQEIAGVF